MLHLARAATLSATAVLALSVLQGCGSDGDAASAPASTLASTPATTPASTSAAPSAGATSPTPTPTAPASADPAAAGLCSAITSTPPATDTGTAAVVTTAHALSKALGGAPVPTDMPADAAHGLSTYAQVLGGIDTKSAKRFAAITDISKIFGKDTDDVNAFFTYVNGACVAPASSAASPTAPASSAASPTAPAS